MLGLFCFGVGFILLLIERCNLSARNADRSNFIVEDAGSQATNAYTLKTTNYFCLYGYNCIIKKAVCITILTLVF